MMEKEIKEHAEKEYPRECCGLLVEVEGSVRYIPCLNISEDPDNFAINPKDYAEAEDMGEIVGIVHSHCDALPEMGPSDLEMAKLTDVPWWIVSWPSGEIKRHADHLCN